MLALQGVSWMIIGSFDPFGVWDRGAARCLYGSEALPAEARAMVQWLLIPFGATDAGFFAMAAEMLRRGRAAGQRWVLRVFVFGVLTWFVLDSVGCVIVGAWWNLWMVNGPALLITMLPALWAARSPWLATAAA